MKQIIAVIFLVFVIVIGMSIVEANDPNRIQDSVSIQEESVSQIEQEKITINITGEIRKPGEYNVEIGLYLEDVIAQAGGITTKADEDCFDYYLLLEKNLTIYIAPVKEEIKISINSADLESLTTLTGIGNTLANRIIDFREKNGSFLYLEQIMEVEGIGKSVFHKIRDDICL